MRIRNTVPVVIRLTNADGVHAPQRTAGIVRRALTTEGEFGLPDFVLFSEVAPVSVLDVARTVAPEIDVVQRGKTGSPEAGVAIAAMWQITFLASVLGSPEGEGIRRRPILGALCGLLRLWACHAPPGYAPVRQALYLARLRARRGLVGGDMNKTPRWMRAAYGRKVRGAEVMCLLVPATWRASKAVPVALGSGHPGVDIKVHVPRRLLKRATRLM